MANIASQKKRILRSERERTENRLLTSTVKTYFRRLETAVESGDSDSIQKEQRDVFLTPPVVCEWPARDARMHFKTSSSGPLRELVSD
jgi:hypothetical protein